MSATDDREAVLATFVKDLLAAEDRRRESLEARGSAVITVCGTLVTLLLGLAALVTEREGFLLRGTSAALVTASVVVFAVAAVLAIVTYAPQPIRITDPHELAKSLPTVWSKGPEFAEKKTTATRLSQLAETQRTNDVKARVLLGAVAVQVIGVALLAAAVVSIL